MAVLSYRSRLYQLCWMWCLAAGVTGTVRLVGGSHYWEGRVEVFTSGGWGTVCDDYWSSTDAKVVCRELGYSTTGAVAYSSAYFGQGYGRIAMDNVGCSGYESRLTNCAYSSYTYSCSHSEDAGVSCTGENTFSVGYTGTVYTSVYIGVGVCLPLLFIVLIAAAVVKKKGHINAVHTTTTATVVY